MVAPTAEHGICLSHRSALEYWRNVGRNIAAGNGSDLLIRLLFDREPSYLDPFTPPRSWRTKAPAHMPSVREPPPDRERLGLKSPTINLLVSSQSGKTARKGFRCHVQTVALPKGSFSQLPTGELVPCPELTFLQMASEMTEVELARYGHELCGTYAIARDTSDGFVSCPPLTSVKKIGDYLDKVERCYEKAGKKSPRGLGKARRALTWVCDGAASPAEAKLCMLLVMPNRLGGYGLPKPQLNHPTKLGAIAQRDFGIDEYICDLSWPGRRLMLEYHGKAHKQRTRHASDVRKENILGALDYQVVVVEKEQLSSVNEMDLVAKAIATGLGTRLRVTIEDFRTKQIRLRTEIFDDRKW